VQVPVAALFRSGGRWSVFRIEGDRARRMAVDIGRNDGRNAQVLSGLEPGDRVVLHPTPELDDGMRVRGR
jgi:HlyD family secretion protein